MKSLSRDQRDLLAKITSDKARPLAEEAVRAAIQNLAVHEKDYRPHMTVEQRQLRNRLRARGRALGDALDPRTGMQEITRLVDDAAYEHWHRLLFTRFLAENHLLVTDAENGHVPVTLDECDELARDLGAEDGFELACRFSSETLPGVFRRDDPILELPLAPNHRVALRKLLDELPGDLFRAQDALGWTYQFWQTRRKKEVNESGKKIGADEISPVTQLFTEDYMVEFLLHNTIGAWWAGKRLRNADCGMRIVDEVSARRAVSLPPRDGLPGIEWTYLRFVKDEASANDPDSDDPASQSAIPNPKSEIPWRPAAGTFDGWPRAAKEITFLDPCMGSGHFPVFALPVLARLRMEEEGLPAREAVAAVLRDNLHGLEIDPRCCQIGAFNIALTAWKLAGHQTLPELQVACCGLAPQGKKEDWVALAGESDRLRRGMARLYDLFQQAPILGSLINPRSGGGDLLEADFHELQPLLDQAMAAEGKDETRHEMAVTARGIAKAAELLAGRFVLVATNVPYLGIGKQREELSSYCIRAHTDAAADLATGFVDRSREFLTTSGSSALVTPQNWLFLVEYKKFRKTLLKEDTFNSVARLGAGAFETISGEVVKGSLIVCSKRIPNKNHIVAHIDVSDSRSIESKARGLVSDALCYPRQSDLLNGTDSVIRESVISDDNLFSKFANCYQGISTTDADRFISNFWEIEALEKRWSPLQSPPEKTKPYVGRERLVDYAALSAGIPGAAIRGERANGKAGVAIGQVKALPATLYNGQLFADSSPVIIPTNAHNIGAVWCFVSSAEFCSQIRKANPKLSVNNGYVGKIPFDLAHWQKVAAEQYPNGLPKPHSNDPTQWLFNGHPAGSDAPLHVAVARLLGYRWPRQTGSSFPDCPALGPDGLEPFADNDGLVCLSALNREQTAAGRLRKLLAAALGSYDERALIEQTGSTKTSLEDWLRDDFFKQHVALFHNRPFVWHLWDGLKDGFHVLVHYHRLDHATLNTLAYTYLGDWIREQKTAAANDAPGAAERLRAATLLQEKLKAILEGEAPLDLFVRWKPLSQQAIGWHPDLNDGVRQNIRPFLLAGDVGAKGAGLFRAKPGIADQPEKADRGTEPLRDKDEYPWFWCEKPPGTDPVPGKKYEGRRWNGVHLTLARKREAQS